MYTHILFIEQHHDDFNILLTLLWELMYRFILIHQRSCRQVNPLAYEDDVKDGSVMFFFLDGVLLILGSVYQFSFCVRCVDGGVYILAF